MNKKLNIGILLFITLDVYGMEKPFGDDILLIINYEHGLAHTKKDNLVDYCNRCDDADRYTSLSFLKEMYQTTFPHMICYGYEQHDGIVSCEGDNGWFAYTRIADAMKRCPGYKGYFLIHPDCIVNLWNLYRFDKDKIWCNSHNYVDLSKGEDAVHDWIWWKMAVGLTAIKCVYSQLARRFIENLTINCGENGIARGFSDITYIPAKYNEDVQQFCDLCRSEKVFLEIALPTLCASLEAQKYCEHFNNLTLWDEKAKKLFDHYSYELDYLHPVDFSQEEVREWARK